MVWLNLEYCLALLNTIACLILVVLNYFRITIWNTSLTSILMEKKDNSVKSQKHLITIFKFLIKSR